MKSVQPFSPIQKPIHKYIHIYRQRDKALNIPIRMHGYRKGTPVRISEYIFYTIAILSHIYYLHEEVMRSSGKN